MHQYLTTSEHLAQVAVATREWARLNPRAHYRDPITVEDVLQVEALDALVTWRT